MVVIIIVVMFLDFIFVYVVKDFSLVMILSYVLVCVVWIFLNVFLFWDFFELYNKLLLCLKSVFVFVFFKLKNIFIFR